MADVGEGLDAWDAVAAFWHERMGEGNDFVDVLIWPVIKQLLPNLRGSRVLDIGCGNGLYARKLAAEGARVTAVDYSSHMIAQAQAATRSPSIEYRVVDATDPEGTSSLPEREFDAVVSTMALMDMSDIAPLFRALPSLLCPNGAFVFATAHPSFNSPKAVLESGERMSEEGAAQSQVRVVAYRTPSRVLDIAIRGQPTQTPVFHRPLSELLRPAFEAGLVLDALEESAFSPDHPKGSTPSSWGGQFHEFPAVLIGRFRRRADAESRGRAGVSRL